MATPREQLQLDWARAAGEEGMRKAVEHAEAESPGVTDGMYVYLVKFAIAKPRSEIFTCEDISIAYAEDLCMAQPADMRTWGPVVQKAKRFGIIELVDHEGVRKLGHGVIGAPRYRSRVSGMTRCATEGIPSW